jgi:hypothetical protein
MSVSSRIGRHGTEGSTKGFQVNIKAISSANISRDLQAVEANATGLDLVDEADNS